MPEETPTTFYYSKRHVPNDYPVYDFKNEIVCVCPTKALASLVRHAMEYFNQPEPEPAQDRKPMTLKDLDTGEPVLFIKVSDFEAMRQEIKDGKQALGSAQRATDYARRERDALSDQLRGGINMRAQLTERALIIKDLESTIAALREDAAKDAAELCDLRILKQKYMPASGGDGFYACDSGLHSWNTSERAKSCILCRANR